MNSGDWRNKLICSIVGCRLNRFWFNLEEEEEIFGPEFVQEHGRIRQCSRCGYAEHHGKVKKGFWPFV